MLDRQHVRGFPLLQLVIVVLVFAAAGVPVWSLTRPVADAAAVAFVAPSAPAAAVAQPVAVQAVFAPAPADFDVQCDGQTVLTGHGPARQFSAPWTTPIPKEGVDFVVRAHWPVTAEAGPSAARVTIRLPDGTEVGKSFWTAPGESLAEIVTVPGTGAVQ